jgi:hypothetical protein
LQLRLATAAIAALGSMATIARPRTANATVALPVPAPTSRARSLEPSPPAKRRTSSMTASEKAARALS